jgi:hypothetical protein
VNPDGPNNPNHGNPSSDNTERLSTRATVVVVAALVALAAAIPAIFLTALSGDDGRTVTSSPAVLTPSPTVAATISPEPIAIAIATADTTAQRLAAAEADAKRAVQEAAEAKARAAAAEKAAAEASAQQTTAPRPVATTTSPKPSSPKPMSGVKFTLDKYHYQDITYPRNCVEQRVWIDNTSLVATKTVVIVFRIRIVDDSNSTSKQGPDTSTGKREVSIPPQSKYSAPFKVCIDPDLLPPTEEGHAYPNAHTEVESIKSAVAYAS